MKTLDYFYENYVSPVVDFLKDWGEYTTGVFIKLLSLLLGVVLFLTLPLWIIPYKVWKWKQGAEYNKGD